MSNCEHKKGQTPFELARMKEGLVKQMESAVALSKGSTGSTSKEGKVRRVEDSEIDSRQFGDYFISLAIENRDLRIAIAVI